MKLFLQIAVYNGGDFWQECWESIVSNIDLIDGVYISFNYSPLQKQDISTIQGFTSEKVKWRKEDKMLSAQEHSRNINRWLSGFDLDGHILVLCHDDILERQGLLKLKEFNLQKNEAVWLGASFFKDKNNVIPPSEYKDIFSEERISSEEFFWTFHERALNVSRCVLPFQAYKMPVCPWLLLSYGYWAEVAYICNPCVEYVRQMATRLPTLIILYLSVGSMIRHVLSSMIFHCPCLLILSSMRDIPLMPLRYRIWWTILL